MMEKKLYRNSLSNTIIISANLAKEILPKLFRPGLSLYISVALFLIVASSCKQNIVERKVAITAEEILPRPEWVSEYPMVFVGNWDAMPIFRRRVGGIPVWQEESYYIDHTEETVKKFKDMGVTMVILHFYKGFGIEAEKEHMEDSKKLASLCKKYGLKVGVYVGSTIGYETFLVERPDSKEWFVPDYLGQPVIYGNQTFRKRVYFMHPGYIEYIKRVLRIAIEDLNVDLIHFDNTSMQAEPVIFYHPLAVENFRTYLKNKYSPEMLKKRFGFSDVSYFEPPKYNHPLSTIDDPLFQEWADFRCQQLADYYGIMGRYIRGLNPEVAIVNNPHTGLSGQNTLWGQGVDYPRLSSHTDFIWTEEGNKARVNDEGVLISKIRTYKMARTLNNRVFTYTSDSKLEMAEAMAYNQQGIGMVGGLKEMESAPLIGAYELPEDQRSYIKFFHKNFEYYHNIYNVADVAVLHSFATMAYNNDLPYQSAFLFEQALIQEKIPFDIIFDDNLKDLSKYKVLVLADQECLSDGKLDLIRSFVNQGGGLVATENTSLYTEWRQRKSDFGLKYLFQVKAPEWQGRNSKEHILEIPIKKNNIGKGRVVYIPGIQPSIPKPPGVAMTSQYWKLPVNWKELIETVQWASVNNLSLSIEAPITVTMELTHKEDKNSLILHLVNFDHKNSSVQNIKVDVLVPEGKKVTQIKVLTPDGRDDEILQFKKSGKQAVFTVPLLTIYDIVVINLE
jgi:glycosyl hydrolase family 42 (putative beta-galactosidase)